MSVISNIAQLFVFELLFKISFISTMSELVLLSVSKLTV